MQPDRGLILDAGRHLLCPGDYTTKSRAKARAQAWGSSAPTDEQDQKFAIEVLIKNKKKE